MTDENGCFSLAPTMTNPTETARTFDETFTCTQGWDPYARAAGLVCIDGWGNRGLWRGTRAQWAAFYTAVAAVECKGARKTSRTKLLQRIALNAWGYGAMVCDNDGFRLWGEPSEERITRTAARLNIAPECLVA